MEQLNDIGSNADAFTSDMEIENIRKYISYFETMHVEIACQWKGTYKRESITDALHDACDFRTDYQFITKSKMKTIQKESKGRK